VLMLDSCCYSKFEEFDVPIDSSGFLPPAGLLYVIIVDISGTC
jgi:hypothetical protein